MSSASLMRKLTAILSTDVAGYSRLSGVDGEGTHRQVMEVLDSASQKITQTGGKVLRYSGDAIRSEFSSAVTAVKTDLEIRSTGGYRPHAVEASALGNLSRTDEARDALARAIDAKPNLLEFVKTNMPAKYEGGPEPCLVGLRKAGLT